MSIRLFRFSLVFVWMLGVSITFHAVPAAATDWSPLVPRLVKLGLDEAWVKKQFASKQMIYTQNPMRNKLHVLYRVLKRGDYVEDIQKGLGKLGQGVEKVDGKYGPATRAAIEAFQKSQNMTVNGLPNKEVAAAVEAELIKRELKKPPTAHWTHKAKHKGVLKHFRLAEAREFHVAYYGHLQAMERAFGVPGEIVTAVITVETRHGRILGRDKAINILASMALDGDFDRAKRFFKKRKLNPSELHWLKETAHKRGNWAFNELAAFLLWCDASGKDPFSVPSSPYGAVGWPQFMPSNITKHGADGDGDQKVDLFTPVDAIHSVGKYFLDYGWGGPMDLAKKQRVVWYYNHSERYVNTILAVADHVGKRLESVAVPTRGYKGMEVVSVTSIKELKAALKPNTRINLEPGDYSGGWTLKLPDLTNVALVGVGQVVLPSLNISNGQEVFLENVTIRPSKEEYTALTVAGSSDITLQHVRIVGPAARGLAVEKSSNIQLLQCLIEGIQGPAIAATDTKTIALENSVVRSITANAVFTGSKAAGFVLTNGVLRDNVAKHLVVANTDSSGWVVQDSYFDDNKFEVLASKSSSKVKTKSNKVSGGKVAGL